VEGCVFCSIATGDKSKFICENGLFFAIPDIYPVSKGHALVISKRHFTDIFQLPPQDAAGLLSIIQQLRRILDAKHAPSGYNVTANVGRDAGQTMFHLHVHVIPRYSGDSLKPEAGGSKSKRAGGAQ
jgi:diadenosine tetraphosphate (Ap4A) HIT family hydrolase